MNHFKNRYYWMLMPPFFIISVLLYGLLPGRYRYSGFVVIILFWVVYYRVIHKKHQRVEE